jgi:lysozyme
MGFVQGVDVSGYNPGTDWSQVAASGISFAFIKASEGITYTNPLFSNDWANSKLHNIYRGAYHFFHPHDDPTLQAKHFLSIVGQLGPGDLPPVLDWEVHELTPTLEIQNAIIWLQFVQQATGKTPIIYSNPAYISELGNPMLSQYPLWLADYTTNPTVPQPWANYTFWQYTDSGNIPGIVSPCDLNIGYGDLNWLISLTS